MKEDKLFKLLRSDDFNDMKNVSTGPYSIERAKYRGRNDIYIDHRFGNWFFEIDPYYSGIRISQKNIEALKVSKDLYMPSRSDKNKQEDCEINEKEEIYSLIENYLKELERLCKEEINRMQDIIDKEIPSLYP